MRNTFTKTPTSTFIKMFEFTLISIKEIPEFDTKNTIIFETKTSSYIKVIFRYTFDTKINKLITSNISCTSFPFILNK